jgi:hypothetical protein
MPNGMIMQWGTFTSTGNSSIGSPQIVTLPIPFPNQLLHATVSVDGANSTNIQIASIDFNTANKTTLSQLGVYSNYTGICKFFVIGY